MWFIPSRSTVLSFIPVAKLLLILGVVLGLLFRRCVSKVVLSTHTAFLPTNIPRRFYLVITITRECRCIFTTHRQLISIKYPIRKRLPERTVQVIVIRKLNLWYSETKAEGIFLCEPVLLRGLDAEGRYTFSSLESPFIEWNELRWESERPFGFSRGGFGDALIEVCPDPTPVSDAVGVQSL